jgi:hypothetical protein
MRRRLHYFVLAIVVVLLAMSQADAGGGSGFGGGIFHGGFGGFRATPGFHAGNRFNGAFRRSGFVSRPRLPFARRDIRNRQFVPAGVGAPFNGFATAFPNTVPTQFLTGFPWWRNGRGWSGPVGGWWPGDWASGGYYGYAYPPQARAPASQPQVIVIHTDGDGRMATAEAPPDFSYVKGCHAIANGYHCAAPTAIP